MLFFYIFAAALAATSAQQYCNIDCPRDANQRCSDGNLPNPEDCGSFCQCANCIPYRQSCPAGTHYNPSNGQCINIIDSNCTDSTIAPTTTPIPGPPRVVTFVANQFPRFGAENPVPFDSVFVNVQGRYRTNTHNIVIPETAIYFNSITAGAFSGTGLNYQLRSNNVNQANLLRTSTTHAGADTTSRDYLQIYTSGNLLSIASEGNTWSEINGTQTSWSIFHLTNAMERQVAFMVGRTSNHTEQRTRVSFDTELLNIGGMWRGEQSQMVVPRSGFYYLFWSAGARENTRVNLDLRREQFDGDIFTDLLRTSRNHNGVDTVSRGMLVQLEQDETLYMWSHEPLYSDANYQTSFGAFEYAPQFGGPVSWSVARTTSWSDANNDLNPVTFDVILANQGGGWEAGTNTAKCDDAGYYFVSINAAALANTRLRVTLYQNQDEQAALNKEDEFHDGNYATSRTLIVSCQANDRFRLVAERGTGLYSDIEMQTSFTGFFLYPF